MLRSKFSLYVRPVCPVVQLHNSEVFLHLPSLLYDYELSLRTCYLILRPWEMLYDPIVIVALIMRSSVLVLHRSGLSYDLLVLCYDLTVCPTIVWFRATIVLSVCQPTFHTLHCTIYHFT